jgi:hypothetical protein
MEAAKHDCRKVAEKDDGCEITRSNLSYFPLRLTWIGGYLRIRPFLAAPGVGCGRPIGMLTVSRRTRIP